MSALPQHVAWVPQWVSDAVRAHDVPFETITSLDELESSAILSTEDILFYVVINEHIDMMTGSLFHDMKSVLDSDANKMWLRKHSGEYKDALQRFASSTIMKELKRRSEVGSPINGPLFEFVARPSGTHTLLLFEKYSTAVPDSTSVLHCVDNTMNVLSAQRTFDACKDFAVLKWFIVHDKKQTLG